MAFKGVQKYTVKNLRRLYNGFFHMVSKLF